jgi:hypothetical protein
VWETTCADSDLPSRVLGVASGARGVASPRMRVLECECTIERVRVRVNERPCGDGENVKNTVCVAFPCEVVIVTSRSANLQSGASNCGCSGSESAPVTVLDKWHSVRTSIRGSCHSARRYGKAECGCPSAFEETLTEHRESTEHLRVTAQAQYLCSYCMVRVPGACDSRDSDVVCPSYCLAMGHIRALSSPTVLPASLMCGSL